MSRNWPEWSTPQREIEVLRRAIHQACRDMLEGKRPPDFVFDDKQSFVDYYIAEERLRSTNDLNNQA